MFVEHGLDAGSGRGGGAVVGGEGDQLVGVGAGGVVERPVGRGVTGATTVPNEPGNTVEPVERELLVSAGDGAGPGVPRDPGVPPVAGEDEGGPTVDRLTEKTPAVDTDPGRVPGRPSGGIEHEEPSVDPGSGFGGRGESTGGLTPLDVRTEVPGE